MVPKRLQGILWSREVNNIDLRKDKNYIVHQILAYGGWNDLKWLFTTYKKKEIIEEFISRPAKDYWPKAFNFIKNYLLKIKDDLDIRKYDRTTPRIIG